jgi:hypothetical protein
MLPGLGYHPDLPLLYFARKVLQAHEYEVETLWERVPPEVADRPAWVRQRFEQAVRTTDPSQRLIVVGKSIGSHAMPHAAERSIAGCWLTPLLTKPAIAAAAASLDRRSVLIGGTADPSWVRNEVAATGANVVELAAADHSLEVAGDVLGSIEHLATVTARMHDWLNALP